MSDAAPEADAIRYAVLRKLASGFRHALMGDLQAMQFSAQLAARLVQTGADANRIAEKLGALPRQCAATLATSDSMIAWLQPDEHATVTLAEGVTRYVKLVREDRWMREIEVAVELEVPGARVPETALRELLVVALFALADAHAEAIDIDIAARARGDGVELRLRARPADREPPPLAAAGHSRALEWRDLERLADVHAVACSCAAGDVRLLFAGATAAA